MALMSVIGDEAGSFDSLLESVVASPAVTEETVQQLRLAFYRRGSIDRPLAARIMHANRCFAAAHPSWTEFYLEALADFFLTRAENRIMLPAHAEGMLIGWIGDGGRITNIGERRLVLRIMLRATELSEGFRRLGMDMVRHNLFHETEQLLSHAPRQPGVVDGADMQLIRKLVCSAGGQQSIEAGRTLADFLRDLDQRAARIVDRAAWHRLLAEIVVFEDVDHAVLWRDADVVVSLPRVSPAENGP